MNELLRTYRNVRPVRYLVTSATDFREIVTITNLIFTRAGALDIIEALERLSPFSVILLPASSSRFIACFDVPAALLDRSNDRETLRLVFGDVELPPDRFQCEFSDGAAKFCYQVSTLFEANLALAHFENRIAGIVNRGSRLALRRTICLDVFPSSGNGHSNRVEFLLPMLSEDQVEKLQAAASPPASIPVCKAQN